MEGEKLAPKGKNNYVVSPKAGVSIRGVNSQLKKNMGKSRETMVF